MAAIAAATTVADYDDFAALCRAYVTWCRERYADLPWFVDLVFGHQTLDAELADPAATYGPPNGLTLLVRNRAAVVAGGAYRCLSADACELKRLFVIPAGRGQGLGRALATKLIDAAASAGYRTIKLDTADRMTEATALYSSLGFTPVVPYRAYPPAIAAHLTFMSRSLAASEATVAGAGRGH